MITVLSTEDRSKMVGSGPSLTGGNSWRPAHGLGDEVRKNRTQSINDT